MAANQTDSPIPVAVPPLFVFDPRSTATLAEEDIAKRASLSRVMSGARAIVNEYGNDEKSATQRDLEAF